MVSAKLTCPLAHMRVSKDCGSLRAVGQMYTCFHPRHPQLYESSLFVTLTLATNPPVIVESTVHECEHYVFCAHMGGLCLLILVQMGTNLSGGKHSGS